MFWAENEVETSFNASTESSFKPSRESYDVYKLMLFAVDWNEEVICIQSS